MIRKLLAMLFAGFSVNASPPTTTVDPNDILFSTSTLNDSLPALSYTPVPATGHRMHEDDWRQFEFIDPAFSKETAAELAEIDRVWKEQSVDVGQGMTAFRKLHVRKRIARPIDVPTPAADFAKVFGGEPIPIALRGEETTIRDVQAVKIGSVILYGKIENDRLTTLGIERDGAIDLQPEAADRLDRFVTQHKLQLVHWPSRTRFETPDAVMKFLRAKPGKPPATSRPAGP